uniref:Uncharacterized protein n=1 Tax=Populus alba TaxID=43335 RepID=A0A4U5P5X6_POPAL|nr:hypothetical protein D5086_0000221870 [Populus alba]
MEGQEGPLWERQEADWEEALFTFETGHDAVLSELSVKRRFLWLLRLYFCLSFSLNMCLSGTIFRVIQKQDWYKPDVYLYKDLIMALLKTGKMEEQEKSPDPPEELPFRILLKGLLPHPLLRNRVKQDYEELFPEKHVYDPPEEIFGML